MTELAASHLAAIRLHDVAVSPKTRWLFVEIADRDGLVGLGEATLQGREALVEAALDRRAPALLAGASTPLAPDAPLPEAAAASALAGALRDLDARRRGVSLAAALGTVRRARIPLYANINRRTLDRAPEGFAASARAALAAGHDAVKIAPFDEVTPALCRDGGGEAAMQPGLERIAAVRAAIGGLPLMVDCHWRFTEAAAAALIEGVAAHDLHWLECPIAESPGAVPAIRGLRARANARGIRLAGCEELVGVAQNRPFAEGGAYDVMMPDAKYVGGPDEMLRVADLLRANGVVFSPHNPSGPVCHALSLQVCAVAEGFERLELQFDESPLFDALVRPAPPAAEAGAARLPEGAGHGASLEPKTVRRHARHSRAWTREDRS